METYITVKINTNSRMSQKDIQRRAEQVADDIMSNIEHVSYAVVETEGEDEDGNYED